MSITSLVLTPDIFDFCLEILEYADLQSYFVLKGEQKKRGRLKLWNALNPKFRGLRSWNFTNLFIGLDKQVGEVSAS